MDYGMVEGPIKGGMYRALRQLGAREDGTHAAVRGAHDLFVVQRFAYSDAALQEARAFAKGWHPNIARIRHVDVEEDVRESPSTKQIVVATELIDGVTLGDLLDLVRVSQGGTGGGQSTDHGGDGEGGPTLPTPVLTRILLDVLVGLQNLHGLRDATSKLSLGAFHGALCPTNIVVGKDGIARLISPFRLRPVRITSRSESLCYAPPEAVEERGVVDLRSDLYACGVMLWEGLEGRRLFDNTEPSQILQRQREEDIPWVAAPGAVAVRLGEVILKTLAFEPALRIRSAGDLANELRRASGTDIATGARVAQIVVELAGERIRARRAELESIAGSGGVAITPVARPAIKAPVPAPTPTRTAPPAGAPKAGVAVAVKPAPSPSPSPVPEPKVVKAPPVPTVSRATPPVPSIAKGVEPKADPSVITKPDPPPIATTPAATTLEPQTVQAMIVPTAIVEIVADPQSPALPPPPAAPPKVLAPLPEPIAAPTPAPAPSPLPVVDVAPPPPPVVLAPSPAPAPIAIANPIPIAIAAPAPAPIDAFHTPPMAVPQEPTFRMPTPFLQRKISMRAAVGIIGAATVLTTIVIFIIAMNRERTPAGAGPSTTTTLASGTTTTKPMGSLAAAEAIKNAPPAPTPPSSESPTTSATLNAASPTPTNSDAPPPPPSEPEPTAPPATAPASASAPPPPPTPRPPAKKPYDPMGI